MSGKSGFRLVFGIILFFLLADCQGTPVITSNPSAASVWHVNLSPSLSWLTPHMNFCSLQSPGTGILLDNSTLDPDIQFIWGENGVLKDKILYALGWDEIDVVVNSKNPLKSIDLDRLRSIFMGKTRLWKSVSKSAQDLGNIDVMIYPSSLDAQQLFNQALLANTYRDPFAVLASEPQEMRAEVLGNPSAIGIIPHRWSAPSLKMLEINSDFPLVLKYPILAALRKKPDDTLQSWLLCLQSAINKTNNP
jgi:hypothetical protein